MAFTRYLVGVGWGGYTNGVTPVFMAINLTLRANVSIGSLVFVH